MKKKYSKPSIYMEFFEMNTAICSCGPGANSGYWGGKPNHGAPDTCEFRDYTDIEIDGGHGYVIMFTEQNQDCASSGAIIPSDADGSIYCYQALSEDIMVFAS